MKSTNITVYNHMSRLKPIFSSLYFNGQSISIETAKNLTPTSQQAQSRALPVKPFESLRPCFCDFGQVGGIGEHCLNPDFLHGKKWLNCAVRQLTQSRNGRFEPPNQQPPSLELRHPLLATQKPKAC